MRVKGNVEPAKIEEVKVTQSKFKKPTTEEMRLAQLLDDKQQDMERENTILEVMEATSRLRDDVIIALHDCNYDPDRAIEVLMDHDDLAKEEWQECGVTKKKKRAAAADDSTTENTHDDGFHTVGENSQSTSQKPGNRRSRGEKDRTADNKDTSKLKDRRPHRGRDDRRSRTVGERHPLSGSNNENAFDWQQIESESGPANQKPHHRRNFEPGADETNEIMTRRGQGRGGSSTRGRSWFGGHRNGGPHDGGRGHPNGVGRARHADRHSGGGHADHAGANSFTVGTWENSDSSKHDSGFRRKQGGNDDWDIDEWDGSLSQTQVFERTNHEVGGKPHYGAIGVKPGQMQPLHVDDAQANGPATTHSPGPVRVTLDSVMNVAGSRGHKDETEAASGSKSKSPRREPREQSDKHKPPTPQRHEKSHQRSQVPTSAQEPPVVILDNRHNVVDAHGPVGLRFGSGLDSFGIGAGGTNGGASESSKPVQPSAAPVSDQAQTRKGGFQSSPYHDAGQGSPQKHPSEIGGEKSFPQRVLPPQQQSQPSAPVPVPLQPSSARSQPSGFQEPSFRPPSSTASHLPKPAGLDPSITQQRTQAQSPYQQQAPSQAKINGDQSFGVQSQPQQMRPQPAVQPQQTQSQPVATSAPMPPILLSQPTVASGTSSSGAFSGPAQGQNQAANKLADSVGKLSVQDVKSPQRTSQTQPPVSGHPQQQQQQQPSQQQTQSQQPATSSAAGIPGSFDQGSMMKFPVPPPGAFAAMPAPPSGTVPYYFPQFPGGQQSGSNQANQSQQPQSSQASTSTTGSVNDYFNSSEVNNLYQRTLLEHGGQQHPAQQASQQAASSPMVKPPVTSQDSRNIGPEQLLNMATAHGQANAPGSAGVPPHTSAAGMPPGGVPQAFLTPQLFYPLMQLFAANPTLMAPFLSQVPPPPAAAADLKSQAQFLSAVGMGPFIPPYPQQQQQQPGASHPDDLPGVGVTTSSHSGSLVVGHQPPQDASSAVGQQHQQSHQQHQPPIRPPPGFLLPVRQSNSGMNMAPSTSNDGNIGGFRAFQHHQQQQQDKGPSAGGPPGLFGQGGPNPGQAAFLAGAGQPGRQPPQTGGVGMKPQQSHMNPYTWNPNS